MIGPDRKNTVVTCNRFGEAFQVVEDEPAIEVRIGIAGLERECTITGGKRLVDAVQNSKDDATIGVIGAQCQN